MDERVHPVRAVADRIRALLESERQRIGEEIRTYPTPIPRCDQQFNQLIDRRELLFQELARLDAAARSSAAAADAVDCWNAFIEQSACLDDDTKHSLKATLSARSGKPERILEPESAVQSHADAAGPSR